MIGMIEMYIQVPIIMYQVQVKESTSSKYRFLGSYARLTYIYEYKDVIQVQRLLFGKLDVSKGEEKVNNVDVLVNDLLQG